MNGEKIELEVLLSTGDLWRSYLDDYFSFNSVLIYFIAFAVYGFFLTFLFVRNEADIFHLADVVFSSGLFVILFGLTMTYLSVKKAQRLHWMQYKIAYSKEKVEIVTPSFTSSLEWNWFVQIKETRNYFTFSLTGGQTTLLPKRCFRDSEQLAGFKNLIGSKLGEKVLLKKSKEHLGLK